MTFHKILIANRGEIATRIIRTAHALGFQTVAVFSDADADAPHVQMADQAIRIGPPEAGASYLNGSAIVAAAKQTGADAIHPGYGFLSENNHFAQRVINAGLTWIGPNRHAMKIMGHKTLAKGKAAQAGVPIIHGYTGEDQSLEMLQTAANAIGYPIMVKAAAGGRGMRLVTEPDQLRPAVLSARSEAFSAFGSDQLLLEKVIANPRHIEVQIFADQHGNIVHLGERDCSIQRRHQKVIEEAPSPAIDDYLRDQIGRAAIAVAKSIYYVGAGTVEFLLDEARKFYFIEMNTRLQVEHPVTELVTGLDLVEWQLLVAAGEPLPLMQEEIVLNGHAIEARLYAESPENNFLPSTGRVHYWRPPADTGVRVDHGLQSGQEITPFYDAMIAKVITFGKTRTLAQRRMRRALEQTVALGVQTNRRFLLAAIDHATFTAGEATTAFVENVWNYATALIRPTITLRAIAAAILYASARNQSSTQSPLGGWGNLGVTYCLDAKCPQQLTTVVANDNQLHVTDYEEQFEIVLFACGDNQLRYALNGVHDTAYFAFDTDDQLYVQTRSENGVFRDVLLAIPESAESASSRRIVAPMPGSVLRINVAVGQAVTKGESLLILKAMKMEHIIAAPFDGTVTQLAVEQGQQMRPKQLLLIIEPFSPFA